MRPPCQRLGWRVEGGRVMAYPIAILATIAIMLDIAISLLLLIVIVKDLLDL